MTVAICTVLSLQYYLNETDWLKIYCFHSSTFDNSFGTVPNSFEVNKKLSKSMEGRATT